MARNIVLFSDGTGNSSSKLQKTNVWRLYETLDLGDPAKAGDRDQIAYYDDGVGNSGYRLFAALAGIFGFGLARNVRELYKFLCRNYRDGDEIYAFGFSRGSYTIRLLVAMITQFGIIRLDPDPGQNTDNQVIAYGEAELDRFVYALWREFRLGFRTNNLISDLFVQFGRWGYEKLIRLSHWVFGRRPLPREKIGIDTSRNWIANWFHFWGEQYFGSSAAQEYSRDSWEKAANSGRQPVKFVGVFDTVAAYGGPFAEITRAIDDWFWPISMPDYRLSPKVEIARHALAIDDKRGSFEPLLWDEVFERANPDFDAAAPRLKQVWFAGMHADVGGGYSDESLSYVSLLWMLEEARHAGLHFIEHSRVRIRHYANPHGFMHDSRAGLGAFYRYQPRYVRAWVDDRKEAELATLREPAPQGPNLGKKPATVKASTGVFRNLVIDQGRYKRQGFLVTPVTLHSDTVQRMRLSSDGYAPINMIGSFAVETTYEEDGSKVSLPDFAKPTLVDNKVARERFDQNLVNLGTHIRTRRFWYFLTMLLLVVWFCIPYWGDRLFASIGMLSPGTSLYSQVDTSLLLTFGSFGIPEFFHRHIAQVFTVPILAIALLAFAFLATLVGMSHEKAMTDIARRNWNMGFSPDNPLRETYDGVGRFGRPLFRLIEKMRMTAWIQDTLAWVKWWAAPFVIGALAWWAIVTKLFPWVWYSALPELWALLANWPTN